MQKFFDLVYGKDLENYMVSHNFFTQDFECSWKYLFYNSLKYTFVSGTCNEPLGMESGAIPDEAITASSSYVPNVGPRNGR